MFLLLLAAVTASWAAVPVYGYVVKNAYPHDSDAFTQGLYFQAGFLYESTGLNGKSSVRKVALETGRVLQNQPIDAKYFGEGIAPGEGEIIGLSWQNQTGFVFEAKTLALKRSFSYPGEGWGLARHGGVFYMSDGSPQIRIWDAKTLQEQRRITVTADGKPVGNLNELEWVEGELFANIWGSDLIAKINPETGQVTGWIDLAGLMNTRFHSAKPFDVLNGIAYDEKHRRLFVTGKLWPLLFEITLVPKDGKK